MKHIYKNKTIIFLNNWHEGCVWVISKITLVLVIWLKLLILDEPTEGIQPNIVQEIGDIIVQLNQQLGLTVLLVEQKLAFARKVGHQFCILDRGCAIAQGRIKDLDDSLIKQYLTV